MKSNKKFNETAHTANFTDFPLIFCGNGPKGNKTMQTQTLFFLRLENIFESSAGTHHPWLLDAMGPKRYVARKLIKDSFARHPACFPHITATGAN